MTMVIYIIIAIVLIGLFVSASESIIKRKSSLIEGVVGRDGRRDNYNPY